MKLAIVIPAHNESANIRQCLESFIAQSRLPDALIVVDDHSTDKTPQIVREYQNAHPWIQLASKSSSPEHQPGSKVVQAFKFGLAQLSGDFDLIGKFDADIALPPQYFEEIETEFVRKPRLGMCSGILYILSGDKWVYEAISDRSHVRGPVKLYRKSCLEAIGGLRESIGWDTVDELLANYYGFETATLETLKVLHLRRTGGSYPKKAAELQGEALYKIGYRRFLASLAAAKMAWGRRSLLFYFRTMKGYGTASKSGINRIVSEDEAKFINQYRWAKIRSKLF